MYRKKNLKKNSVPGKCLILKYLNIRTGSGLSAESFLAFCDFKYSKFLNSFLTFFQKQGRESTVLHLEQIDDTFKCSLHLTVRVCTTKKIFFSEHVLSNLVYCVLKIRLSSYVVLLPSHCRAELNTFYCFSTEYNKLDLVRQGSSTAVAPRMNWVL